MFGSVAEGSASRGVGGFCLSADGHAVMRKLRSAVKTQRKPLSEFLAVRAPDGVRADGLRLPRVVESGELVKDADSIFLGEGVIIPEATGNHVVVDVTGLGESEKPVRTRRGNGAAPAELIGYLRSKGVAVARAGGGKDPLVRHEAGTEAWHRRTQRSGNTGNTDARSAEEAEIGHRKIREIIEELNL